MLYLFPALNGDIANMVVAARTKMLTAAIKAAIQAERGLKLMMNTKNKKRSQIMPVPAPLSEPVTEISSSETPSLMDLDTQTANAHHIQKFNKYQGQSKSRVPSNATFVVNRHICSNKGIY